MRGGGRLVLSHWAHRPVGGWVGGWVARQVSFFLPLLFSSRSASGSTHVSPTPPLFLASPTHTETNPLVRRPPRPPHRFVCRAALGEGGEQPAAYLKPVPPGAVVYGSGDAAVVVSKASGRHRSLCAKCKRAQVCVSFGAGKVAVVALPAHRLPACRAPSPAYPSCCLSPPPYCFAGAGGAAVPPQHAGVQFAQGAAGGCHRGAGRAGQRAGVRRRCRAQVGGPNARHGKALVHANQARCASQSSSAWIRNE